MGHYKTEKVFGGLELEGRKVRKFKWRPNSLPVLLFRDNASSSAAAAAACQHLFELLPLVTMAIRAYFRDRPSDF